MESEGLNKFLEIVGDAVHSVNTICVGLSSVASGAAVKPSDLTIGWSSSNPDTAAAKARLFALRGSLVFVEEALLKYLDFLKACLTDEPKISTALASEGAAERVIGVSKFLSNAEPYWWPMVVLLIRWRNKVVHESTIRLTVHQANLLTNNADALKNKHAGIEISQTLSNFESGQITLKDFTTLIAVTVRFVRMLDEELEPRLHTLEGFEIRLKQRNLVRVFNQLMNSNGEETRRRKLKAFLQSEFSAVPDTFFEEIYKNGPISQPRA
ncbi:hypothetical protein [Zhongshania aquimaris]|uniref:Uncharacterized protein n=1 Tax=Zhongshania aquimaris TaxID=2857107 RepID=A0ABS6VSS7_9GAMM|nr:hypothetical protein [Zhongshania aquimaris]MBW2941382.1 hypothetical protein [Zhongshania aquimaris]